ncbi:MAG: septum formation protein Maf [Butyricicoccus pullicaecorum]|nr:septum formation protein Maf [Butyricicoccus pullicaecorum]
MKHIILASASPRRQELLRLITEEFAICPADADETLPDGLPVERQIETLAFRKAEAVFRENPGCTVIGSDTMVVVDGTPLGKPKDAGDARRMLHLLSGRVHEVITGLAVLSPAGNQIGHRTTKVYFRALTGAEIDRYIATGEPLDKAGAYGIQGRGATLITGIEGDYFSVVGLPVELLYTMLAQLGYIE